MSSSSNPRQKIQKDESYLHCSANYPPVYLLIFFGCCLQHQSRRLSSCFMSTSTLQQQLRMGGRWNTFSTLGTGRGKHAGGGWAFSCLQNIRIPLGPARGWKEWDKAECARQEVGGCVSARVRSSGFVAAAVSHVIHVDVCILLSPQDACNSVLLSSCTAGSKVMTHSHVTPHRCLTFDPPLPLAETFLPKHGTCTPGRLMFYRPSLHLNSQDIPRRPVENWFPGTLHESEVDRHSWRWWLGI